MSNDIKHYERSPEEEKQMGKETAARFSKGKIRHDLIPSYPINELAKVYTYGCEKYDTDNWRKGLRWRKDVIGSLKRHLDNWIRGEKNDLESGLHHLSQVLWNVCTLMEYERCGTGIDDRNPYDMDLLATTDLQRRLKLWLGHVKTNTIDDYDGLKDEPKDEPNDYEYD